jgi:hypothetical protein
LEAEVARKLRQSIPTARDMWSCVWKAHIFCSIVFLMEGENYETSLGRLTRAELLEMTLGIVSQLNEQQIQNFSSSLNAFLAKKTEVEEKKKRKEDHPFEMAKSVLPISFFL